MGHSEGSESTSASFAHRFAELLIEARRSLGMSCRALARRSAGRFGVADLHAFERGEGELSDALIDAIGELYGVDADLIRPHPQGLHIGTGVVTIGAVGASFTAGDPTSLLTTYLHLVRGARCQPTAAHLELRRADVEHLARHVEQAVEAVVAQLAALMGVTRALRLVRLS